MKRATFTATVKMLHSTRRLFRLRFSMRGLLILVTALSLLVGWFAMGMQRAERQAAAVKALQAGHVVVVYDYMVNEDGQPTGSDIPPSGILRSYLGNDFFSDVIEVQFPAGQLPKCGLFPLQNLHDVRRLSLHGAKVRDGDFPFDALLGLQSIDAAFTDTTDATVHRLAALPDLLTLDLTGTLISDASLESLSNTSTLLELRLQDVAVSAQAVGQLKKALPALKVKWSNAPSRKHLLAARKLAQLGAAIYSVSSEEATTDIEYYLVPGYRVAIFGDDRIWNHWKSVDAELAALADIDGISTLMLGGLPLTEETGQMLSKLPELRSLELSRMHVLSEWFPRLHPKLLHLSLSGTTLFGRHEFVLSNLPQLELLSLANTGIGDRSLARLEKQSMLRQIDLSATLVTDNGMTTIARLNSLERVFLNRTGISDFGLVELQRLKSIRELRLCMTNVSDSGMATLAKMETIEELDLSFTGVTDAGIAKLQQMPHLRNIHLSGAFISDKALEYLAGLRSLEELWLVVDGNRVTKAGIKRLQTACPQLRITIIGD